MDHDDDDDGDDDVDGDGSGGDDEHHNNQINLVQWSCPARSMMMLKMLNPMSSMPVSEKMMTTMIRMMLMVMMQCRRCQGRGVRRREEKAWPGRRCRSRRGSGEVRWGAGEAQMDDRDAPAGYGMGSRGKAVMMMIMLMLLSWIWKRKWWIRCSLGWCSNIILKVGWNWKWPNAVHLLMINKIKIYFSILWTVNILITCWENHSSGLIWGCVIIRMRMRTRRMLMLKNEIAKKGGNHLKLFEIKT